MEEQEQLKAFVSKINAKTKELRSQNTRLEAMVIIHTLYILLDYLFLPCGLISGYIESLMRIFAQSTNTAQLKKGVV